MRAIAVILFLLPVSALAGSCDDLVAKVAHAAQAEVGRKTLDFAEFKAADGLTLTLSCGGADASAVGVQHRGEAPPDAYYETFGRAGEAVTGISGSVLADAARRARSEASRLRHGTVPTPGALVTCTVTERDKGGLTMCAVIEQGNRG